jgi:hypothetical protein
MPPPMHYLPPVESSYGCLAHTPLRRMVKPNILFTPSITWSTPYCFRSMPPRYWVEGLHTTTYLLNHLPCMAISVSCPYVALYSVTPTYEHLRIFGCVCYPNLSAQAAHKLVPRSTRCVFLGYSTDHKGYRCLDLSINKIIVSQHVVFDEAVFPFAASSCSTSTLGHRLADPQ